MPTNLSSDVDDNINGEKSRCSGLQFGGGSSDSMLLVSAHEWNGAALCAVLQWGEEAGYNHYYTNEGFKTLLVEERSPSTDRSGVFSVRDGRESPVRVRSAKEGLKNRGRVSKP
ncbi:hypothetical protein SUGI_0129480 [Cryptomeria japonica]|nr:hypothetical protein SUGI_0129480 [Cryptomeria japonica]